jgi:hypothetical protein
MEKSFSSSLIKEALTLTSKKLLSKELDALVKGPSEEKNLFLKQCLNKSIEENNSNPQVLIPLFRLLDQKGKEIDLWIIARDATLLNYALFNHDELPELHLAASITPVKIARTIMPDNCKTIWGYIKRNPNIEHIECYSFRLNGKTFVMSRSSIKTDEGSKEYWPTALKPTVFPEMFLSGEVEGERFDIRGFEKKIETFLCCSKRWEKQKGIKIPKAVVNACIIKPLFEKPLKKLENNLTRVKVYMEEEIEKYNKYQRGSGGIRFSTDPIQEEFYTTFSTWYTDECDTLLSNKFAIIQQLLACQK